VTRGGIHSNGLGRDARRPLARASTSTCRGACLQTSGQQRKISARADGQMSATHHRSSKHGTNTRSLDLWVEGVRCIDAVAIQGFYTDARVPKRRLYSLPTGLGKVDMSWLTAHEQGISIYPFPGRCKPQENGMTDVGPWRSHNRMGQDRPPEWALDTSYACSVWENR